MATEKAGEYPPPPYSYSVDIAVALYPVKKGNAKIAIPDVFSPYTAFGNAYVAIFLAKYHHARSDSEKDDFPYDEVGYALPVRFKNTLGIHIPKLYVNGRLGYLTGKEPYGFPKVLSKFEIADDGKTFKTKLKEDDKTVFKIEIKSSALPLPFGRFLNSELLKDAGALFYDFGSHIVTKAPISSVKGHKLKGARLNKMEFPEVVSSGLVKEKNLANPLIVAISRGTKFRMEPPVRIETSDILRRK